jgi:hypothetical protein
VVRNASYKFIHGRLVVHARGQPWKISSSNNPPIEQANKALGFFA